jgi:hypothetical protein
MRKVTAALPFPLQGLGNAKECAEFPPPLSATVILTAHLKSGRFAKSGFNRFTDGAEAAEACGSNNRLTVKICYLRPIREPISSVSLLGINGFQKVTRHQHGIHDF